MPWRVFITAADWLGFDGIDAATGKIPHTYAGCPPSYAEGEERVSADPDDGGMMVVGPDAHRA